MTANNPLKVNKLQLKKPKIEANSGAKLKIKKTEFFGIIISLKSNFKASENGCNNPKKPTLFGPNLC